jgi:hypothetical protein
VFTLQIGFQFPPHPVFELTEGDGGTSATKQYGYHFGECFVG